MEPELILSDVKAARALAQQHSFLGNFLEPSSPSEVAQRVGLRATLAHHHARRLMRLGLLQEQRREAGRVYYQLSARRFRVPISLLPPGDPDETAVHTLSELSAAFLNANARSWSYAKSGQEEGVYGFETQTDRAGRPTRNDGTEEAQPAYLDGLTLRLSPERYSVLASALSHLLTEAAREGASASGEICTLAVLGFRNERWAKLEGVGRTTSTFLPWPDPSTFSDQ